MPIQNSRAVLFVSMFGNDVEDFLVFFGHAVLFAGDFFYDGRIIEFLPVLFQSLLDCLQPFHFLFDPGAFMPHSDLPEEASFPGG